MYVRACIMLVLLGSILSQAQAETTSSPAINPSTMTPEQVVSSVAGAVAAEVSVPKRPTDPDTKNLTQLQASAVRAKHQDELKIYQDDLAALPDRLHDMLQRGKKDYLQKDVEWVLQIQDVSEQDNGAHIAMTSDSGTRVNCKLSEISKAQMLKKGQFVTVKGSILDLQLERTFPGPWGRLDSLGLGNGLAADEVELEKLIAEGLLVEMEADEIEPVENLILGIVISTGSHAAVQQASTVRATLTAMPEAGQFLFLTGPYQPKGMTRRSLSNATKENVENALAMSQRLPRSVGGSVLQAIRDAHRAVNAGSPRNQRKLLFIYAGQLSEEEAKSIGQLCKSTSHKITVCLWLSSYTGRFDPKVMKHLTDAKILVRNSNRL